MISKQVYKAVILIIISTLFTSIISQAEILNVPSQYNTIKLAIVYAEDDDTILVSPGDYTGLGNRDLDFGRKPITLMSLKGPHATKLDCQGTSAEPHRVFRLHQRETNRTVIQGFTITGGYAPPTGPDSLSFGGGLIVVNGSSPIIRDCVIIDNFAFDGGGGVYCSDSAAPIFINCIIQNNETPFENAGSTITSGGGVLLHGSSPTFDECLIADNISARGGGLSGGQTDLTIINSQIRSNCAEGWYSFEPSASGSGGGLYLQNSNLQISGSEIYGNRAMAENRMHYYPGQGGGLSSVNSTIMIDNCTIVGNYAKTTSDNKPGEGGGLYLSGSSVTISKSIIAFSFDGEAVFDDGTDKSGQLSNLNISCSDFYENFGGDWVGAVSGFENVDGNFSADPLFCNIFSADFHLLPGSPCEAIYNDCQVLIGGEGVGCMTDIESDQLSASRPFELLQNWPNPFNPTTTISYRLSKRSSVSIEVFNLLGQRVRQLVRETKPVGLHSVVWDGRDDGGAMVASGIYLYKLISENQIQSKQMILLK